MCEIDKLLFNVMKRLVPIKEIRSLIREALRERSVCEDESSDEKSPMSKGRECASQRTRESWLSGCDDMDEAKNVEDLRKDFLDWSGGKTPNMLKPKNVEMYKKVESPIEWSTKELDDEFGKWMDELKTGKSDVNEEEDVDEVSKKTAERQLKGLDRKTFKGKVDQVKKKMPDVKDPEAFVASRMDSASPGWRKRRD